MTSLQPVRTSAEWIADFRANDSNRVVVPWESGVTLTPEERELVAGSLPVWQLGESSDGRHLRRAAERYAARSGDRDYVEAIALFIREEQRHGAELGRALDLAGIPRKSFHWGDSVFRLFRHFLPRIEITTTVVIAVEIHAMIYYAAIRSATKSEVLRRVCEQILRDEVPHLRFQCERMAQILHRRPRRLRAGTLALHRLLFAGTTVVIWLGHRRALRAGGYTFRRFWRAAWARFRWTRMKMAPEGYSWPEPAVALAPALP